MHVTNQIATLVTCLGGKLTVIATDPGPKAAEDVAKEYNCANCSYLKLCQKVYRAVEKCQK